MRADNFKIHCICEYEYIYIIPTITFSLTPSSLISFVQLFLFNKHTHTHTQITNPTESSYCSFYVIMFKVDHLRLDNSFETTPRQLIFPSSAPIHRL